MGVQMCFISDELDGQLDHEVVQVSCFKITINTVLIKLPLFLKIFQT